LLQCEVTPVITSLLFAVVTAAWPIEPYRGPQVQRHNKNTTEQSTQGYSWDHLSCAAKIIFSSYQQTQSSSIPIIIMWATFREYSKIITNLEICLTECEKTLFL
jgi:hypothetical protein